LEISFIYQWITGVLETVSVVKLRVAVRWDSFGTVAHGFDAAGLFG